MTARDLWWARDALASRKSRSCAPRRLSLEEASPSQPSRCAARAAMAVQTCVGAAYPHPRRRAHPVRLRRDRSARSSDSPVVSIKQQEEW